MRVVCAPDKFRGSVSAADAAAAMAAGARTAGWSALACPIADGGEGTREAVLAAQGGRTRQVDSVDALGRPAAAPYLILGDGTAVVVAADIVGLAQLSIAERDPIRASSYGLGAPILAAASAGVRRVTVFLGGTATMDGGVGLLRSLGAEFRDSSGRLFDGSPVDMDAAMSVDLAPARGVLSAVEVVVATDVDTRLAGPDGAARVFGPQKGADDQCVERLDQGLTTLATYLNGAGERPGSGAAGGLGAALMAIGGLREPGAELVLDLVQLSARLAGADLCITGEGRVDRSTLAGKAVAVVAKTCQSYEVPCVVLGGTLVPEADLLYARGVAAVLPIGRAPRSLPAAVLTASADLQAASRAVCSLVTSVRH
jgi:glycerate kinase